MRARRRATVAVVALAAWTGLPGSAAAAAVPSAPAAFPDPGADLAPAAANAPHPFIKPRPRPTEALERPGEGITPSRDSYNVPEAPQSPACGANFCVHWVDQGLDAPSLEDTNGDGIPDYVERVLAVAEHVHHVENEKLGWREPVSDGTIGGGYGKTDIYLSEIGPQLFGYAAPDRGQIGKDGRAPRHLHGYLVLDNDYNAFEFPHTEPGHDLKVTLAHEYNHILQFGYDAYEDSWFAESTAVWMEDQVYNGINDYLRYVRSWVKLWETPADRELDQGVRVGGLERVTGPPLRPRDRPRSLGRGCPRPSRRLRGRRLRTGDPRRRAVELRPRLHPLRRRCLRVADRDRLPREVPLPGHAAAGTLALGAPPATRRLNHTTFSLIRVHVHSGSAVEVEVEAPEGVDAGLALVGRIGSERHGRTVKSVDYAEVGGKLTATLPDPGRFQRITAVVVNADAKAAGYDERHLDWRYLTEETPFRISGRIAR